MRTGVDTRVGHREEWRDADFEQKNRVKTVLEKDVSNAIHNYRQCFWRRGQSWEVQQLKALLARGKKKMARCSGTNDARCVDVLPLAWHVTCVCSRLWSSDRSQMIFDVLYKELEITFGTRVSCFFFNVLDSNWTQSKNKNSCLRFFFKGPHRFSGFHGLKIASDLIFKKRNVWFWATPKFGGGGEGWQR